MRDVLRLVRFPLCLSAAADSAAGYLSTLASRADLRWGTLGALAASSALLYCGGIALNDYADRERDRTLHPQRPLPAGRITPGRARAIGLALIVAGAAAAAPAGRFALVAALVAALFVLAYDFGLKRAGLLGAAAMAGARACNFAMGAVAVLPPWRWDDVDVLGTASIGLFVFALTAASLLEERARGRVAYVACAALMLAAVWPVAALAENYLRPALVFPVWLALLVSWRAVATLSRFTREELQRSTAWHVRGITVLSAGIVAARADVVEAAAIAAVIPVMMILGGWLKRGDVAPAAAGLAD